IFLAPFHRVGENPTLALARDMELIEWLDHLGYDEVWVGEHHSAGWETIASPEVFIAAAAERTRHIMLGSGVTSLPYHHPLMVANRFVLLDHMTRGDRKSTRLNSSHVAISYRSTLSYTTLFRSTISATTRCGSASTTRRDGRLSLRPRSSSPQPPSARATSCWARA